MSDAGPALSCPRCATSLTTWSDFRGLIGGCPGCAGVWAEMKDLKAATVRPEAAGHQRRTDGSTDRELDLELPVNCPRCSAEMERVAVGEGELEVHLDRCDAHGSWFDAGEVNAAAAALAEVQERERQAAVAAANADDYQYAVTPKNLYAVQLRADVENYKRDPFGAAMSSRWTAEAALLELIGDLFVGLFKLLSRKTK